MLEPQSHRQVTKSLPTYCNYICASVEKQSIHAGTLCLNVNVERKVDQCINTLKRDCSS